MIIVRFVTGSSGRAGVVDKQYPVKAEALAAIAEFNGMKSVRKIRDPKTGGTLYIATRPR